MSDQIHTAREEGNLLIVDCWQDVEPYLKDAAAARRQDAENRTRFGKRPEFRRTMTLPFNVIEGVAIKLGIPLGNVFGREEQRRIMRDLKSTEFKALRTTCDKRI